MQRMTKEEFIRRAQKIHKDEFGNPLYDYSKVEYINSRAKVTIICPEHGEFSQVAGDHLREYGCPKCGIETLRQIRLSCKKIDKTEKSLNNNSVNKTEKFIQDARKVHGDKYDYSRVNYISNIVKVEIICPIHGSFFQVPNSHKLGMGCPICGNKKQADSKRDNKEAFIEKARKVHGDKYDYSKVKYVNSHTPVEIICPVHGSFMQSPNNHLNNKNGCLECGRDRTKEYINTYRKLTLEDFITRAKAVHGDKYDYSKSEYINYSSDIKIICPVHGEFILKVSDHLSSGRGCPKCGDHHYVGEDLVESWIINNKFIYESQYRIESISRTTGCVRIDFRLIINDHDIWIEYNGVQHYEFVEFFHDGKIENFNIQLERDRKIREYCKINNIKLIEVPYIYKTEETIFDFLDKTITQGIDPNLLIDYSSFYK